MNPQNQQPRKQAEHLTELASREGASFRGVLLGKRGEGKTDLLRQVHARLFVRAEGPIPILYAFRGGREEPTLAQHFFASFCQQVRAFLMRQEELLREPVAHLERELERPGLPLSLTELARNFQSLPPEQRAELVAALPAQFAHVERRPVCLLLDEAQEIDRGSPILAALYDPGCSWLLGGRYPFLLRVAGESAWPSVSLEPFSLQEALELAERECRAAGLRFAQDAWEEWLGVTGTSPWLLRSLVNSAAAQGHSLDSIEELGRLYIRELGQGTLGNWLAARFEQALPDRRDRARVAQFLETLARTGAAAPAPSLPPALWDGLVAEEWAVETAVGPKVELETVQWDWLWLVTASLAAPPERAQARALQTFLLRAEQRRNRLRAADRTTSIRQRLLELPQRGFPADFEWAGGKVLPPEICAVSLERSGAGELFWCYGFHGNQRDSPEAACVLLIALCGDEPAPGQIEMWRRQLENEERLLPAWKPSGPLPKQPLGPRRELWLVLPALRRFSPGEPAGVSPAGEGAERRFSVETFSRLLEAGAASESRSG